MEHTTGFLNTQPLAKLSGLVIFRFLVQDTINNLNNITLVKHFVWIHQEIGLYLPSALRILYHLHVQLWGPQPSPQLFSRRCKFRWCFVYWQNDEIDEFPGNRRFRVEKKPPTMMILQKNPWKIMANMRFGGGDFFTWQSAVRVGQDIPVT